MPVIEVEHDRVAADWRSRVLVDSEHTGPRGPRLSGHKIERPCPGFFARLFAGAPRLTAESISLHAVRSGHLEDTLTFLALNFLHPSPHLFTAQRLGREVAAEDADLHRDVIEVETKPLALAQDDLGNQAHERWAVAILRHELKRGLRTFKDPAAHGLLGIAADRIDPFTVGLVTGKFLLVSGDEFFNRTTHQVGHVRLGRGDNAASLGRGESVEGGRDRLVDLLDDCLGKAGD